MNELEENSPTIYISQKTTGFQGSTSKSLAVFLCKSSDYDLVFLVQAFMGINIKKGLFCVLKKNIGKSVEFFENAINTKNTLYIL